MLTLLTTVVLGVIFAIFATQNTEGVAVNFGNYTLSNIPIYLVILVPLLIGLLLAYFIYVIRDLSQNLTIDEQKEKMQRLKKELAEVAKAAHKFQVENIKIKKENGEPTDPNSI